MMQENNLFNRNSTNDIQGVKSIYALVILIGSIETENQRSYCRSTIEFPVAINEIDIFEQDNNVSVNVLAIGGGKEKHYILRKSKFNDQGAELR